MELKSEHSRQGVSVTFTYEQSTTLRGDEKQSRIPSGDESENNISCVSLMWMNYKGEEVEYKRLHPGVPRYQSTFLTTNFYLHPSSSS